MLTIMQAHSKIFNSQHHTRETQKSSKFSHLNRLEKLNVYIFDNLNETSTAF